MHLGGEVAIVEGILYWAWLTLYGKNILGVEQTPVDDTHSRPSL